MLKRKISKADHEALSDDMKAFYKALGDDFVLDLDEDDDFKALTTTVTTLRRENKTLKTAREKAQSELDEARTELEEVRATDPAKRSEIATLEASWKKKHDKAMNDANARNKELENHVSEILCDKAAAELAAEVSTVPKAMQPIIRSRLTVEYQDGAPVQRVLDTDGKISALSLVDLKKELLADKELAGIVKASNARGGGTGPNGNPGGGAGKPFKDMNEPERLALYRSDRATFERESEALRAAQKAAPIKPAVPPVRLS